jgi:hypothetical protein
MLAAEFLYRWTDRTVPTVPLLSWTFHWLGVDFNPAQGRAKVRRPPKSIVGWAYWSRFKWNALWNNKGRLCLQVGGRQFFHDEGWVATLEDRGIFRIFRLVRGPECAVVRRYSRVKIAALEIISDDNWGMTDFWRWVSETWQGDHEDLLRNVWKIPIS